MKSRIITSARHRAFQHECYGADGPDEPEALRAAGRFFSARDLIFRAIGDNAGPATGLIDGASIRRVVIFRYDAIGDYIISTMLIRWLRAAIPGVRIDVLSSFRNAPVVAADPNVDWSYPLHPDQTLLHPSMFHLVKSRRGVRYDLVFALSASRMTRGAIIARALAPEAEKISLMHRDRVDLYGRVFHRQLDRTSGMEHWGETYLRMATGNIAPVVEPRPEEIRPYLVVSRDAWIGVEEFMRSEGLGFRGFGRDVLPEREWRGAMPEPFDGDPYAVVNISAHCRERQWSPDRCAMACRELIDRRPWLRIYISGAPADADDVRHVVDAVGHPNCRPVSMKLTEFIPFVAGAALVITPDTATLHIAAAAGRPVVGLYAEQIKAAEWYPYGTQFRLLISPSEESINLILPEDIAAQGDLLLTEAEWSIHAAEPDLVHG